MTELPKFRWVEWPEDHGTNGAVMCRLMTKEYRAFRYTGKTPEQWAGRDTLGAPDRETGKRWARDGIPRDALLVVKGPWSDPATPVVRSGHPRGQIRPPVLNQSSYSYESYNMYPLGIGSEDEVENEHTDENAGAYARVSMEFVRKVMAPHDRLAMVLARHAAMRRRDYIRVTQAIAKEAGIPDRPNRRRAIDALEELGVIRTIREPGKCIVVRLKIDRHGHLTTWDTRDLKVVKTEGEVD